MKRRVEVGLVSAAETVCVGIAAGLYQARNAKSDGALGWAPDFPADHAGYVVEKFLALTRYKLTGANREKFTGTLIAHAPEWAEMFRRIADDPAKG